jgi:hypothetical protein
MKTRRRCSLLITAAALTLAQSALACGEIKPSPEITTIVKRLAYKDFPQASDILSIIRIESSFNPKAAPPFSYEATLKGKHVKGLINAKNLSEATARLKKRHLKKIVIAERETSNGLMQVQNGSEDLRENIAMGVSLLREYYMLTKSKEGAVKSYNIGPNRYLAHKATVSSEAYYDKFLLQKKVYVPYVRTGKLISLGKTLGCGSENGIPLAIQARLSN